MTGPFDQGSLLALETTAQAEAGYAADALAALEALLRISCDAADDARLTEATRQRAARRAEQLTRFATAMRDLARTWRVVADEATRALVRIDEARLDAETE